MEFTWGFLVFFIALVLPGLTYRRLYFFGEFSKQFAGSEPFFKAVSLALIPGVLILVLSFYVFDFFVYEIDLGNVVDTYKNLVDPSYRFAENEGTTIRSKMTSSVLPFLSFEFTIAIILGSISGRIVRLTGLDTKWKLFRFKNQWFYLIHGHHRKIKKFKYATDAKGEYLFTQADVLLESESGSNLYSGIILDYELDENDCSQLSRIILRDPSRYSGTPRVPKPIPSTMFVLDCKNMTNINLTHFYGESKELVSQTIRGNYVSVIGLLSIIIFPFFFFQFSGIEITWYKQLFQSNWVGRLFFYFAAILALQLINPFVKNEDTDNEYELQSGKQFFANLATVVLSFFLAIGIEKLVNYLFY